MAEIKWIKITTDIFSDEKIILIEQLKKGDAIIVIWFKLLCLAGKENNNGVFMMSDKIPYTEEMLATIFRRPIDLIKYALSTFEQYGMVRISENNVISLPNWEKHQNVEGMEKIREQSRERKRKQREREKNGMSQNNECDMSRDSHVTSRQCHATEEDIEEDIEKDNNTVSKDTVCTEPETGSKPSGIRLPLNDKSFYDVPSEKIEFWKGIYPAVDVVQQLKQMAAWCDSNPNRRKTRRGIDRFITNWLAREQDKGRSRYCNPGDSNKKEVEEWGNE